MRFYVDSADIEEIERALELGFVQGVTTNPTLLKRAEVWKRFGDIKSFYAKLLDICEGEVFVQIPSGDPAGIIGELKGLDSSRIVVKIPSVSAAVKTVSVITDAGYSVCATAVYTPVQAAVWSSAAVDYVAVYVDRMKRAGIEPFENVSNMAKVLSKGRTKILAASLKNAEQVNGLIERGVDRLTAGYDLLKKLVDFNLSSKDAAVFDSDANEFMNRMKKRRSDAGKKF